MERRTSVKKERATKRSRKRSKKKGGRKGGLSERQRVARAIQQEGLTQEQVQTRFARRVQPGSQGAASGNHDILYVYRSVHVFLLL